MTEHVDTGDVKLDKAIKQWLDWDKNVATRQEVIDLLTDHNMSELQERFGSRIQFGTAGLRSAMEAGTTRINDLIIVQTAQGILKYIESTNPECKSQGVVIGYDARHCSQRFAHLTATIMLQAGMPVYLFSDIVPTPFVPYAIKKYGCAAGVMVTPSHNPKGDNGYKVYWSNGAQIIPPQDKGIANHILQNLEPWEKSWDTSVLAYSKLLTDPFDDVFDCYIQHINQKCCYHRSINEKTPLKFTYTAMHGVGTKFIKALAQAFGFKPFIMVKEQVEPDPEFPTVKYPNPEEGKSALDLSMSTAEANDSTIIIANDPDADRLALAERQRGGEWKIFTGNELGALLGWWIHSCVKKLNGESADSDYYMLASTVSSKILQKMADVEGFKFMETLTGFKWMGNKAEELTKQGKTVLFAFEEAIGFMCGTMVLDKDGISAGLITSEMAAYLDSQNLKCSEKLDQLYSKYGYHVSDNSYFICNKREKIDNIFQRIRTLNQGTYPSVLGESKVTSVRDLTTGYDSSQPDKQAILPVSASSHMITFTFDNGVTATLRTSGTEPKIKYYTEMCGDSNQRPKEEIKAELHGFVETMVVELLQPEMNRLVAKTN